MSMETQLDRGTQGAKRASWTRVHYRDLALKVVEEHPDLSVEELAELFLDELKKYPDYMHSIAIYVMANIRASLSPRAGGQQGSNLEAKVVKAVAAKAMTALMSMMMPSGKTLGESTGAECIKAGGWLAKVGSKVGPKGIVGEKLDEEGLQKLFKAA